MRVCLCVHPRPIKNYSREMKSVRTSPQFLCMALAIDTIDGWGLSNEVRCELLP